MSAKRKIPMVRIRPGESWQDCARRLAAANHSSRVIAEIVGHHHTTVLYVINAEFRRDKVRHERRRRAALVPYERQDESRARAERCWTRPRRVGEQRKGVA